MLIWIVLILGGLFMMIMTAALRHGEYDQSSYLLLFVFAVTIALAVLLLLTLLGL